MKQRILLYILSVLNRFIPTEKLPQRGDMGVVIPLCHEHVTMFIVSLHSFLYFLKVPLPCLVIDDGTLTDEDTILIRRHFQNIKILTRPASDALVIKKLKKFPHCLRHRQETSIMNNFNIKLFDTVLTNTFKKIILLDADVLFLNTPHAIREWITSKNQVSLYARHFIYPNYQREQVDPTWLIILRMFRERINKHIDFGFNSGLICLHRHAYKIHRIESILEYMYSVGLGATWAPEQYIFSTLLAETNNKHLGDKYIHTHSSIEYLRMVNQPFDYVAIHFAFLTKPKFYKLALLLCLKTKCFRNS